MASPPRSPADAGPSDLSRRRRLLGAALGGLGAATLPGCGSTPAADRNEAALAAIMAAGLPSCSVVATETEGPFPLRAALADAALLRADITDGRSGVPLTLRIKLVDVNNRCAPIAGAWVYVWHCDREGRYSGYDGSAAASSQSYLRGIQKSDADGVVTFTTIYPGWYEGRITHVHCMVFLAGSALSSSSPSMATTQFAFPEAATAAVYASPLYDKGPNRSVTRVEDDNVFADGIGTEMLAVSGSVQAGYAGGIVIGVDQTASNPVGFGPRGGRPPGGPPVGMPPDGPPRQPPAGWGPAPPRGGPPPRSRGGPT